MYVMNISNVLWCEGNDYLSNHMLYIHALFILCSFYVMLFSIYNSANGRTVHVMELVYIKDNKK